MDAVTKKTQLTDLCFLESCDLICHVWQKPVFPVLSIVDLSKSIHLITPGCKIGVPHGCSHDHEKKN